MTQTASEEMDSYKRGLLEGKMIAVEQMAAMHSDRLDKQDQKLEKQDARIRILERAHWLLIGAITIMQFGPEIKDFFK